MKLLPLIALCLSLSPAAFAAEIRCVSDDGKLALRFEVPADIDLHATRNFKVENAEVHIDAEYLRRISEHQNETENLNDRGVGGLMLNDYGQFAVRTVKGDYLVSMRTEAFANGVAAGRFEDGAGGKFVPGACHFFN